MESRPSPLDRLLQLERDMEHLRALVDLPQTPEPPSGAPVDRPVWPGDELLLTRLLRRSPIALEAYRGAAELTASPRRGLRLTAAAGASEFHFCELPSGDAVVWLQADPPAWIWDSEVVAQIFRLPAGGEEPRRLVLQCLPLFKPVVRHQQWTLVRQGEMLPQPRPFAETAEQVSLLRRLESLERRVAAQQACHAAELAALRQQVAVIHNLLDRLLRPPGTNA